MIDVKTETIKIKSYPKLMRGNASGMIVLFSEPRHGIVLDSGTSGDPIGWGMSSFSTFDGEITLKNR